MASGVIKPTGGVWLFFPSKDQTWNAIVQVLENPFQYARYHLKHECSASHQETQTQSNRWTVNWWSGHSRRVASNSPKPNWPMKPYSSCSIPIDPPRHARKGRWHGPCKHSDPIHNGSDPPMPWRTWNFIFSKSATVHHLLPWIYQTQVNPTMRGVDRANPSFP